MATKFNFKAKARAVVNTGRAFIKVGLKDASMHFDKGFDNQGFTDEVLDLWEPRQGQIRSLGANVRSGRNVSDSTRKNLEKSGNLRRSQRVINYGLKGKVFYDSKYAPIHNFGLRGMAWGKYPFTMPTRLFIAPSKLLQRRTMAKCIAMFSTAIKNA